MHHCSAVTCLVDWIIARMTKGTGTPNKLTSEHMYQGWDASHLYKDTFRPR